MSQTRCVFLIRGNLVSNFKTKWNRKWYYKTGWLMNQRISGSKYTNN